MNRIKVTAGVIVDNDKVMITRRAPHKDSAGGWEFPGGKIEVNESPEDCLVRELKEELNIDVFIDKFCTKVNYNYPNKNIKLIAYYCRIIGGSIRLSVHDNYMWVKISDLLIYDLLPPDITIAKKVIADSDK